MCENEIKVKSKPSHAIFKLAADSIVWFSPQTCDGIIKGCLNCLTSVSKRRFLVNNILMFASVWSLVMVQIQFSLIKKIKTGCPEHLLTAHTPLPYVRYHLIFALPPSTPLKDGWMSYLYYSLTNKSFHFWSVIFCVPHRRLVSSLIQDLHSLTYRGVEMESFCNMSITLIEPSVIIHKKSAWWSQPWSEW